MQLVSKLYAEQSTIPLESESLNDKMLNKLITKTACEVHFDPCVEWARVAFDHFMNLSESDVVRYVHVFGDTFEILNLMF